MRLVPSRTAVLIVDMLNDFVHPEGRSAQLGNDVGRIGLVVPVIARLVDRARALGMLIVWVRQSNLPYGGSDSPAWLAYKIRNGRDPLSAIRGTWGQQVLASLDLRDDDFVVDKSRPSAFTHSSLDGLLRANEIVGLIVCGCVTEGCVEATVRDAAYHDYVTCVADDAVASLNARLHAGSMEFMRSRFPSATAETLTSLLGGEGIPVDL